MHLNDDQLTEVFESVYERSDADAREAPEWSAIPKPVAGDASGWRGPLVAVMAAAAVFLIIGAVGVLFASWSGSDAPPASGNVEGMVLELYLANDIDDEQLQLITETLTTQSGVIDWRYISKAEAYEAALVQYADSEDDLRIVEENPDHFTASILLLVANATDLTVIRTFAFETFPAPTSGLMGGGSGWGTLANPPFGISLPWPPINGGWVLESLDISGVEATVGPGVDDVSLSWIEIGTALAGHADCTSFRGPPDGYSFTDGVLIPGEITVRNLECDSFIVDAFIGMLQDNPDGIDVELTTSGMVWAAGQSRLVFTRRFAPVAIAQGEAQNGVIGPIDSAWHAVVTAAGGEPASDEETIRLGAVADLLVPGSGFRFASSTQDDPPVDEIGIVLFLATDLPGSGQIWACLNNYAIIGGKNVVGGTRCSSEASELLSFGFGGGGSCVPSRDVAPMLISVWGLPETATDVQFEIGDDRGQIVSVPVTASGTAQIVTIGQFPVWSVNFDGITSNHQTVLDQFLPAFENIEQVCGDSGGG